MVSRLVLHQTAAMSSATAASTLPDPHPPNAELPVISRPTMSDWIESVPSKV